MLNMNLWINLFILGITTIPGLLCDEEPVYTNAVEISMDISQSHAHKGDNVTLVCNVANMPETSYIIWAKTVLVASGSLEQLDQIATDDVPILPYTTFTNYHFSKNVVGSSRTYTLSITNVNVQETGTYICSYLEIDENVHAMEDFHVYQNAEDISVYLNDSSREDVGERLAAEAGDTFYMRVEAGHSVPAARITVYVGDDDVTEAFVQEHETDIKCSEGGSIKTCPLHYTHRTVATSWEFSFKPEHRDSKLVISTSVPELEPFNRTIALDIDYAPQFKCLEEHSARLESEYMIACKVRSYPEPYLFYWLIPKDGVNLTLSAKEHMQYENYTVDSQPVEDEENTWAVSLTISYVGPNDFMNYFLMAGNDLGNNTLEFTLIEDTNPVDAGGAPPMDPYNVGLLLCAAFLVLLRMSV